MSNVVEKVFNSFKSPGIIRENLLNESIIEIEKNGLRSELSDSQTLSGLIKLALLFCTWIDQTRFDLTLPIPNVLTIFDKAQELIELANKIGQPHLAKIVYERVQVFLQNKGYAIPNNDLFKMEMCAAKTSRLLGDHDAATTTYLKLLNAQHHIDPVQAAKVILNIGKMSHTFEWRTGLYLQLAKIAENRFLKILKLNDANSLEIKRQIALCIDCRCQTELLIRDPKETQTILKAWLKALSLVDNDYGVNSYRRISLRYSFAAFQRSEERSDQCALMTTFAKHLRNLEDLPDEKRGLAVRYGQYAEMLAKVKRYKESDEYLDVAIVISRDVSDWGTLASNVIRKSVLQLRHNDVRRSEDVFLLQTALEATRTNFIKPRIDIEIQLLRQMASHYTAIGDRSNARRSLELVVDKLALFEKRILVDTEIDNIRSETLSISKRLWSVLSSKERIQLPNASMVDYAVHSRYSRSVVDELLDATSAYVSHTGGKQTVNLSRLAVSTVLHDQRSRVIGLLTELRTKFNGESNLLPSEMNWVVNNLDDSIQKIESYLNDKLSTFSPNRSDPYGTSKKDSRLHISKAITVAMENGRFKSRFPEVSFELFNEKLMGFSIGFETDLLVVVLETLIENAAKMASSRVFDGDRFVKLSWDWQENSDKLNPMAIIQIEDTGGEVNQLSEGLALGVTGRYGLMLAEMFFKAIRGQMMVEGVEGKVTTLKICLEASEFIRRDGTI